MTDMTERRMCWIGLCAVWVYVSIWPICQNGIIQADELVPARTRIADAFKKVAPLLDKKHYDEAGAILREIAIRRTQESRNE